MGNIFIYFWTMIETYIETHREKKRLQMDEHYRDLGPVIIEKREGGKGGKNELQ